MALIIWLTLLTTAKSRAAAASEQSHAQPRIPERYRLTCKTLDYKSCKSVRIKLTNPLLTPKSPSIAVVGKP